MQRSAEFPAFPGGEVSHSPWSSVPAAGWFTNLSQQSWKSVENGNPQNLPKETVCGETQICTETMIVWGSLSHPLLGNPSISLLADYKPLRLRTWYQKASRKAVHSCHIIHQNVWSNYGRMVKSCGPRRSKKLLGTLHATIAAHRQGTPSTMAFDVKTQLHEVTISTGSKVPQLKPPFPASVHRSDHIVVTGRFFSKE